jgi:ribosomal protein L40E
MFVFLYVPTIILLFIGKQPSNVSKKIIFINAIVMLYLDFIIITLIYEDVSNFKISPAIIWSLIGYALLNNGKEEYNNKKICPHCKCKNDPKRENCFMCGKSLFEEDIEKNEQENIDIESK